MPPQNLNSTGQSTDCYWVVSGQWSPQGCSVVPALVLRFAAAFTYCHSFSITIAGCLLTTCVHNSRMLLSMYRKCRKCMYEMCKMYWGETALSACMRCTKCVVQREWACACEALQEVREAGKDGPDWYSMVLYFFAVGSGLTLMFIFLGASLGNVGLQNLSNITYEKSAEVLRL